MKEKFTQAKIFSIAILLVLLMSFLVPAQAQYTQHYVPGVAGIKAGTLPPPGMYYIMHNVYYNAGTFNDASGNAAPIDFKLNVFSNVHRFVYVWEDVILGANYAMNLIVPLVSTDISIGAYNMSSNKFGLGDIVIEPFVLSWNRTRYDLAFGLAAIAPTGGFAIDEPASAGKGYWTGMLTFGGTYYFDENKTWTASVLSRYEIHSEQKDTEATAGNDFTFEWGLGKTIPSKQIWNVGFSGYAHWQVTEDKGGQLMYDLGVKDKVFAAGPEVDCFIPSAKLQMELRGLFEFGAVDRPQGALVCLTLIKAF